AGERDARIARQRFFIQRNRRQTEYQPEHCKTAPSPHLRKAPRTKSLRSHPSLPRQINCTNGLFRTPIRAFSFAIAKTGNLPGTQNLKLQKHGKNYSSSPDRVIPFYFLFSSCRAATQFTGG